MTRTTFWINLLEGTCFNFQHRHKWWVDLKWTVSSLQGPSTLLLSIITSEALWRMGLLSLTLLIFLSSLQIFWQSHLGTRGLVTWGGTLWVVNFCLLFKFYLTMPPSALDEKNSDLLKLFFCDQTLTSFQNIFPNDTRTRICSSGRIGFNAINIFVPGLRSFWGALLCSEIVF